MTTHIYASADHYIRRLHKCGFKTLDSGRFSTVLARRNERHVVKVFSCGDGEMDMWGEYIYWATLKGYAGRYAPKVYSFKTYASEDGDFYVAFMERFEYALRDFPRSERKRFEELKNAAEDAAFGDAYSTARNESPDRQVRGWQSFMCDFAKHFRKRGLDLHNGNWLIQGERLCLSDPLSWIDGWHHRAPSAWRYRDLVPQLELPLN